MAQKQFNFKATGLKFNLETFMVENTVIHTDNPRITFQSKEDFINLFRNAIKTFMKVLETYAEEDVEFTITYKHGTFKRKMNRLAIHAAGASTNEFVHEVIKLVQITEAELKQPVHRGINVVDCENIAL